MLQQVPAELWRVHQHHVNTGVAIAIHVENNSHKSRVWHWTKEYSIYIYKRVYIYTQYH